jgi:O-antigen ligase
MSFRGVSVIVAADGGEASNSMTLMTNLRVRALDRRGLEQLADWLAVGVAASLPWSTSATGILVVLWSLAVLPTLDMAGVRRELLSAAGGLPVLFCALAALGMLWADVSWHERIGGFDSFHRFRAMPLLLAQLRRSENGFRVLFGFFLSVAAVLFCSWVLVMFPSLPWHTTYPGVPAKDYILQSTDFLMCAFVLFALAFDDGRAGRWCSVLLLIALAVLFLANIAFVATGRTTLLVAPVLVLLLGWREFGWKGALGAALLFSIAGVAAAVGSSYLNARLEKSIHEFQVWESSDEDNSTSEHLEFMKKAVSFVRAAPIIGHGTGSISEQYRNASVGKSGIEAHLSGNPHNQILNVAIQLGLVGATVLMAMWIGHFMLFRGSGLTAWIGIVIVTQNVASSLVNSHLFDFTQSWLYVFGVGVAGGMALRERERRAGSHETDQITA